MASKSRASKQAAAEVEQDWRTFPRLPGTHLSWCRRKWRTWDLVSGQGAVWATIRHAGGVYGVGSEHLNVEVKGRSFEMTRQCWTGQPDYSARELTDSTGTSVLRRSGSHFHWHAGSVVWLLDGGTFTFPVVGRTNKALMSAVDESGVSVIRYRLVTVRLAHIASNFGYGRMKVEIVVSPQVSIPRIELLVAVTYAILPCVLSI